MKRFLARLTLAPVWRLTSDPPAFVSGGLQLFFRGFIANPTALAAEARRRGHDVADSNRTALLALAYQWWGADLPRHVLGEYALAICDAAQQVLLLTHDELGLTSLFYSENEDRICFASLLEDLTDEVGTGELDEEYIADHIAEGRHFGSRTPYKHIRGLLPGKSLLFSKGRISHQNTWTITNVQPIRYRDDRDYECHFLEVLQEAVKSAIPETGKVWCELSGGLDSSTVLSLLANAETERLEAVSFVFPRSPAADESQWMRIVLEKYSVPWHTIDADSARPFTEVPHGFMAEPNDWFVTYGINRRYVEFLHEHTVAAVLTGQGGDAVFFGDRASPYFLADLLRTGSLRQLWQQAQFWQSNVRDKRSASYWLSRYALFPAWRHLRKGIVQDYPHRSEPIPWIAPSYARAKNLTERGRTSYVPQVDSVANSYFLERVLGVANLVAKHYCHRRAGSYFRHPLFYRPLLEFMLSIPPDQQLSPIQDRPLQRRSLTGILPDATLRRKDKGASDQAFYEGLESGLEWFKLLTDHPRVVERGYVDRDAWHEAVLQAQVGRTVGIRYFLATANLEAWLRQLENYRPSKHLPVLSD